MDFLTYPIRSLAAAQCFILLLAKLDLMFHFDDGPHDTLLYHGHINAEQADHIDDRLTEIYRFNWGPYDCPLGFFFHHEPRSRK